MGTPYEGKREINDIQGFSSPEGAALPNDDLDLQLAWLRAMDELGPDAINSKVLGEYWISYIGPCWNEYGVCKGNMREGILPPLSGEMNNEEWKHSNGAWIRTEIWACVTPGCPEKAIRYAFEDASVDHGFGEGTYAAIFVAAMESAAFVVNDLRTLLHIGLSKIPEDCRVARSVGIVIKGYDEGLDWKTVRNQVVQDSADLGWFQAPANVAFVVIGLLYGKGNFKKSMILAINCGDDTDCTGATIGSLMGIMYGTKGIPEDWKNYIGDGIVTISLIKGSGFYPETCQQLTDCVMNLIPAATRTRHFPLVKGAGPAIVITDGPDDFSQCDPQSFCGRQFVEDLFSRSPYSFTGENCYATVLVEFEREPIIAPHGELKGKITVKLKNMPEQKHFQLRWFLPEGWHVEGTTNLFAVNPVNSFYVQRSCVEFVMEAGETVAANSRVILEVSCCGRPTPILVPITILG